MAAVAFAGAAVTTAVGAVLTIAGLALSGSGAATFRRNRTTVVPHHPVSTLVTKGPHRISRNPMYTGLAAAHVGAALWVGTWWAQQPPCRRTGPCGPRAFTVKGRLAAPPPDHR